MPAGYYDFALDLLLDEESQQEDLLTEEQHEMVESAAELLYGLIHARFILTARGLAAMLEKFKAGEFGKCPRVLCAGQGCLPVGQSDLHGQASVKIFCPKCEDIYFPRSKYQVNIDAAYFGTTFPHLFLLTYGSMKPARAASAQRYVPRIFGFRARFGWGFRGLLRWFRGHVLSRKPRRFTTLQHRLRPLRPRRPSRRRRRHKHEKPL